MKTVILLENNQSIKIPKKVIQYKQLGDFIIVLTDANEVNKINNENVYGYDVNGNQLWQIENLNLYHEKHDYTRIYIQDSALYLYNRSGVEVKINAETGSVLSKELIR